MIDLIDECASELEGYGYKVKRLGQYGIDLASLSVDSPQKSKALGFGQGEYVIVNSPLVYDLDNECHKYIGRVLGKQLSRILESIKLNRNNRFLIVGIGNPDILADSLGKKVLDKISINPLNDENNIFKICPNIYINTGISTYETVYLIANTLDVDCIILIDSLATKNINRLGISFQLNSAGITPGSAMHDKNKKIDKESTGISCISFGVPFMIFASDLVNCEDKNLVLAPKDIHENVDIASKIIAYAISDALKLEE